MATRERAVDRGTRVARADLARVGSELRIARVGAGLSLRAVGSAVGRTAGELSRIERALVPNASVVVLARMAAVVGLDLRVHAYPGPDPIRDAGQSRLLERLRRHLPEGVTLRTEVPLPAPGDLRAWDGWIGTLAALHGERRSLPVEAETRVGDGQAMLRRLHRKLRDAGEEHVLLLVADTRLNRAAVAALHAQLDVEFPVSGRAALAALRRGRHPGGSAIILL